MCIRDRFISTPDDRAICQSDGARKEAGQVAFMRHHHHGFCLLYTSDAADERSSVDLGGRRIIKKKKKCRIHRRGKEDC